jgi:hypothetical protein
MRDGIWYYAIGDRQHGPVAFDELVALARAGRLSRTDLLWQEGMLQWVEAGSIPELFARPAPAAAPQRPAPQPQAHPRIVATGCCGAAWPLPLRRAKLALVLAVIGLVVSGLHIAFGLAAVVLAAQALGHMQRLAIHNGRGIAIAALVIGVIDLMGRSGAVRHLGW